MDLLAIKLFCGRLRPSNTADLGESQSLVPLADRKRPMGQEQILEILPDNQDEGLSVGEIAEALNLSPSTVRTELYRLSRQGLAVAGIELDPRYVDVAVKRWQEFTGKSAILEGDGRNFSELEKDGR